MYDINMNLDPKKKKIKQLFAGATSPGTWRSAHGCITGEFQDAIAQGAV